MSIPTSIVVVRVHDARIIEELGIGYARGGNLRPHLQALGLRRVP